MLVTRFKDVSELKESIGREVGVSDWLQIDQDRIDQFAKATDDFQWIHTDPVRAAKESPFGKTIAHGFLSLSLIPHFMYSCLFFEHSQLTVNYGLNKLRFTSPVLVGSKLRAIFKTIQVTDINQGVQIEWLVTLEIEGQEKPALVGSFLIIVYHA
ncbi:MaoC family dehydratase [Polynucleobacter kasalickyi]|uniref:Acyl dehydratase n=1 Tax=Polynucleobacter kasalickyi TaxID=1938817 RepID=A0A1W2BFI0_9BURK|nr:MaoC family dehydratase [Polynucleobacter kasalickyi]SMC71669.1 Acyl dehydratase [Polynucleobacter kasalickyi]